MADSIALKVSTNGIGDTFKAMLKRSNLSRGWLNRVAYPLIIEAQRIRWASENASEGGSWLALNDAYRISKLKRYAAYPGAGSKMLVATSRLVNGVTGDVRADHYKLTEEKRIYVGTTISYAKYVNDVRNFTLLGQGTINVIKDGWREYIRSGT